MKIYKFIPCSFNYIINSDYLKSFYTESPQFLYSRLFSNKKEFLKVTTRVTSFNYDFSQNEFFATLFNGVKTFITFNLKLVQLKTPFKQEYSIIDYTLPKKRYGDLFLYKKDFAYRSPQNSILRNLRVKLKPFHREYFVKNISTFAPFFNKFNFLFLIKKVKKISFNSNFLFRKRKYPVYKRKYIITNFLGFKLKIKSKVDPYFKRKRMERLRSGPPLLSILSQDPIVKERPYIPFKSGNYFADRKLFLKSYHINVKYWYTRELLRKKLELKMAYIILKLHIKTLYERPLDFIKPKRIYRDGILFDPRVKKKKRYQRRLFYIKRRRLHFLKLGNTIRFNAFKKNKRRSNLIISLCMYKWFTLLPPRVRMLQFSRRKRKYHRPSKKTSWNFRIKQIISSHYRFYKDNLSHHISERGHLINRVTSLQAERARFQSKTPVTLDHERRIANLTNMIDHTNDNLKIARQNIRKYRRLIYTKNNVHRIRNNPRTYYKIF